MDDSEVLSNGFLGLRTSAASMASMTSTASFHQKITDPDGWIIPSTKIIKTRPVLLNGPSKIEFFTHI